MNFNGNVDYHNLGKVLLDKCYQKLNIDKNQLCDISILLGTDYMKFNHKLKPEEIYKLISFFNSVLKIMDLYDYVVRTKRKKSHLK